MTLAAILRPPGCDAGRRAGLQSGRSGAPEGAPYVRFANNAAAGGGFTL